MDIQWEDPPDTALKAGQRPGRYVEFAQALRDNPGRWALAPGERTEASAKGFRQNVLRGEVKGFDKGEPWEAAVDKGKVWVRYNPTGTPEPPKDSTKDKQSTKEKPPAKPRVTDAQDPRPDAATVRAWATTNGLNVPTRGRLSDELFDAYSRALNRGETGLHLRAVRDGDTG